MSMEELQAIEAAFRKQRESEQQGKDRFLEWVQETAEAEETLELRQRVRELEIENESLREFPEEEKEPFSREEFDEDLILSDEAEVLSDMLAAEELDKKADAVLELTDAYEPVEEEDESE